MREQVEEGEDSQPDGNPALHSQPLRDSFPFGLLLLWETYEEPLSISGDKRSCPGARETHVRQALNLMRITLKILRDGERAPGEAAALQSLPGSETSCLF